MSHEIWERWWKGMKRGEGLNVSNRKGKGYERERVEGWGGREVRSSMQSSVFKKKEFTD